MSLRMEGTRSTRRSDRSAISLLVEGDVLGTTKQRVIIDATHCFTPEDVLETIIPQLSNAETGSAVDVSRETTVLQFFSVEEMRYEPLEDINQLQDKQKMRLVSVGHHTPPLRASSPNKEPSAPDAEEARQIEERVAVEVAGMAVAKLSAFLFDSDAAALNTTEVDGIVDAVMKKHRLTTEKYTLIQEMRAELAAGYVVGRQRRHPNPLDAEAKKLRETALRHVKRIESIENENAALTTKGNLLADEVVRLKAQLEQTKARLDYYVMTTPSSEAKNKATGAESTPPKPGGVPSAADSRESAVASHPTPGRDEKRGKPYEHVGAKSSTSTTTPQRQGAESGTHYSTVSPSYAYTLRSYHPHPTTTSSEQPPSTGGIQRPTSAKQRPTSASSTISSTSSVPSTNVKQPLPSLPKQSTTSQRTDPTYMGGTALEQETHMVTCFYNDYDSARRMNVKRGRALVLSTGPTKLGGTMYQQLMKLVASTFKRDDLSVGYTHTDGATVLIDTDAALKAYLELADKQGVHRPTLQCFDADSDEVIYNPIPPSVTTADSNSPCRNPTLTGLHGTTIASSARTPSRPTSASSARPSSALSSHSHVTASSVPVESASGTVLDDQEMRFRFSQVSKDNIKAPKTEVLRYVQLRYEDFGDAKRFQRVLDKFTQSSLTYDQFCIVLLRLEAS